MTICCICGKKISILDDTRLLIKENKKTQICENCYNKLCDLKSGHLDELYKFEQADNYFKANINNNSINKDLEKTILNILHKISYNSKEQIETEKITLELSRNKNVSINNNTFLLTTGYNFEGYNIKEYLNIVSGEIVLGTGFLSEISASFSDVLGKTNQTLKDKLSTAKNFALTDMISKAKKIDANAIIGIDFDILTTSNNIFIVSVNGTAVKIEHI